MEPLSALAYVLRGAEKCKSFKSRPCENSLADFCTSETESSKNQPPLPYKEQMVKLSEVQKSAKEISHGLDFGNDVFIDLKHNRRYFHNKGGLIQGLNLRRYCNFGPMANKKCQITPLNKQFV